MISASASPNIRQEKNIVGLPPDDQDVAGIDLYAAPRRDMPHAVPEYRRRVAGSISA